MTDQIASGIVVVRVKMVERDSEDKPFTQLWAAALPREAAVVGVLSGLPNHWSGELTDLRLTQEHVRRLNMKLGSVKELSDADVQDS